MPFPGCLLRLRVVCSDWPKGLFVPLSCTWLANRCCASAMHFRTSSQSESDICSETTGEQWRRLSIFHCNGIVRKGLPDYSAIKEDLTVITDSHFIYIYLLPGYSSSPQWLPCHCFCWSCRPHLFWPSPLCIFESNLKMGVSPSHKNKFYICIKNRCFPMPLSCLYLNSLMVYWLRCIT